MGENSTADWRDSPSRIAAKLTGNMIDMLRATVTTPYASGPVQGNGGTRAALIKRGLLRTPLGRGGLTDLGRRVAYAAGINILLIDQLHAEALADPRQRAERYVPRSCCHSVPAGKHSRTCATIEARQQWAPAGSAHGPADNRETLRDEIDASIDRLIAAAKYRALSEVLRVTDDELRRGTYEGYELGVIGAAVNAAADAMGIRAPWTPAP